MEGAATLSFASICATPPCVEPAAAVARESLLAALSFSPAPSLLVFSTPILIVAVPIKDSDGTRHVILSVSPRVSPARPRVYVCVCAQGER